MPASLRSVAHAAQTLGGDPVVAVPTGTVDGDLLIAWGACAGGSTITAPAGWTQHPSTVSGQGPLWYRTANSEPANYTFTVSGVANSVVSIACIKDTLGIEDADGVIAASGNIVIPSVDSGGSNRYLFQVVAKLVSTTFTGPGSQTERFDTSVAPSNYTSAGGDEIVGAGATGTRTWVPGTSSSGSVGYMLAILPGDATVTVPAAASATASGQAPAASASSSVAGATATSTAAGQAPTLAAGATMAPPASEATGAATAPTLSAGVDLSPPAAEASAAAPFGGVSTSAGATLFPTAAQSTAQAGDSSVSAGASLAGAVAEATADASAPSLSLGVTIDSPDATASADGVEPSLLADSAVSAATATATADAPWGAPSGVDTTLFFDPPTQDQSMPDEFWGRFSVPVGISVVKVNGHYANLPTPTHDELEAVGTEGTDWFRGGYHYEVSEQVASDLTADGYTSISKDAHVY